LWKKSWKPSSTQSSVQSQDFALGDGVDGVRGSRGGGGGVEERSRLWSKPAPPSFSRRSSGASSSKTWFGDVAGTADAVLFLERMAARWLTLDAASVFLTRFTGLIPLAFDCLVLAAAALGVGVGVVLTSCEGCAATAAKDRAAVGEVEVAVAVFVAGPFTVADGATGRADDT